MSTRISREELYMKLALDFAERSTCLRGQVGCVLVRDKHVVGAGYNGAPPGMPHCLDVGCGGEVPPIPPPPSQITHFSYRKPEGTFPNGCTRAIHAEANALAFSARQGVRTDGASLYCTHAACRVCAQLLVSAGIVAVTYKTPYRDEAGLELLNEAEIEVFKYGTAR